MAVTPTSCSLLRCICSLSRKRSIRFTVRYSVSGISLNLRCTSTSQSIRIARILALMSVCLLMYEGEACLTPWDGEQGA